MPNDDEDGAARRPENDAHLRALHESREPAVFGPTDSEVEAARARLGRCVSCGHSAAAHVRRICPGTAMQFYKGGRAEGERAIDPLPVALYEGPAGAAMRGGPAKFWTAIAGEEVGVQFGLVVELLAAPGFVESLREAIASLDRGETTGPILDPTFWSRSRNAFGRSRLCRHLLGAGVALGEAERKRRAEWDGGGR